MKKIVIAFVPVLHEGYRRFFTANKDADIFYICGLDIISLFPHLAKEIRMLNPELVKVSLRQWPEITRPIEILSELELNRLNLEDLEIIMPDEDIMHELVDKYFSKAKIFYDPVFLRWDKHNTLVEKPINSNIKMSSLEFDKKMISVAKEEAQKSSDWWRRVGAVVIKGGDIILSAHNHHVPSEHTPYIDGDPRNNFHKGDHLELSTAIHAEASIIAEAAQRGLSLSGAEIYVVTFPCPPCAKLIAYSGIKKIYYRYGYGVLDGESILKNKGVEIVFVEE